MVVNSELQKLEANHQISLCGMCTLITQLLFGVNYKTWNIPLIIVDDAYINVQVSEYILMFMQGLVPHLCKKMM